MSSDEQPESGEGNSVSESQQAEQPPAPISSVVIPPEAVRRAAEHGQPITLSIETFARHTGPLPPPDLLQAYEAVYPGLPKIIVDQFLVEGQHRRRLQTIGLWGALSIALASIVVGAVLAALLKTPWAALAVIGPVCGTLGTAKLIEYWLKTHQG